MKLKHVFFQKLFSRHFLFFVFWILISLFFQFHKVFFKPPLSIHQGAQADRASIALSYYRVNMNFFEPRVMETATKDGITPCEFPIINYTVALLYNVFGFNSFWYRFLMWVLMGIGLWAVFDMLCIWLNNKPAAFLISYTWYFSSILIFYTPNFLPDTASLAFMLLALRQWFLHNADSSYRRIVWFTIFAALACLIKVTSLVFVISIVSLSVLDFLKTRKKTNFIGASLIIFILVFGWYFYGHWLEKQVGGSYFLMNMAVPSSIAQLKAWFHIFYSNWFAQIYNYPQWVVIGLGIVSVPFVKEKLAPRLFACIALLGAVCIYLLMAGQFCYHDYYSITLLPVFLFFMVFCFKWIYDFKPLWSYILIFGVCIWSFAVAKKNHRLRYSPGHYSYQTFFEPSDFKGVDEWLTKNSVTKNDKVLAAFDPNPNTMLYFLERRGCRTFDHTQSYVNGKLLLDTNLVTNDSLQFFKQYPASRDQIKLKSTFNKWTLYKLK